MRASNELLTEVATLIEVDSSEKIKRSFQWHGHVGDELVGTLGNAVECAEEMIKLPTLVPVNIRQVACFSSNRTKTSEGTIGRLAGGARRELLVVCHQLFQGCAWEGQLNQSAKKA